VNEAGVGDGDVAGVDGDVEACLQLLEEAGIYLERLTEAAHVQPRDLDTLHTHCYIHTRSNIVM